MSVEVVDKKESVHLNGVSFEINYQNNQISNINYVLSDPLTDGNPLIIPIDQDNCNDLLIIDSIHSGTGRQNKDFYALIIKPILLYFKIEHTYHKTDSKDYIANLAKTIKNNASVAIISGDTSIFELINNISKDITFKLFPFPLGTGNALSVSLGFLDEFIALQAFLNYFGGDLSLKRLPLYKAEFPEDSRLIFDDNKEVRSLLFTVVMSWATHAKLVFISEKPELRLLGIHRFKVAAQEALTSGICYNGEVSSISDKKVHNYFVVVAAPNFEKTYKISPSSDIFKKELYLLDVGGLDIESTLSVPELTEFSMKPYNNGAHINSTDDRVIYEKIDDKDISLTLTEDDENNAFFTVDGVVIQVKNPKGKSVKVSYLDDDDYVNVHVPFLN